MPAPHLAGSNNGDSSGSNSAANNMSSGTGVIGVTTTSIAPNNTSFASAMPSLLSGIGSSTVGGG